jgi:hypothetical protein
MPRTTLAPTVANALILMYISCLLHGLRTALTTRRHAGGLVPTLCGWGRCQLCLCSPPPPPTWPLAPTPAHCTPGPQSVGRFPVRFGSKILAVSCRHMASRRRATGSGLGLHLSGCAALSLVSVQHALDRPPQALPLSAPPPAAASHMQIGRNYADHAAEMNAKVPTEPVFFLSECCPASSYPGLRPTHRLHSRFSCVSGTLTCGPVRTPSPTSAHTLAEPPSSIVRKGGNIEVPKSIGKVHYEVGTERPARVVALGCCPL